MTKALTTLGNPSQQIPINAWNGQLFMYGYSHAEPEGPGNEGEVPAF